MLHQEVRQSLRNTHIPLEGFYRWWMIEEVKKAAGDDLAPDATEDRDIGTR